MFKRLLIKFALKILKLEVLDKIQYAPVQILLQTMHKRLETAADIVTDNDPDNRAQFAAYWQTEKLPLSLDGITTVREIIKEEVQDERSRTYIVEFLNELEGEILAGNILKVAA